MLHVRTLRRLLSMREHIPQSMATSTTPQSGMLQLLLTISSHLTMRETTHSVRTSLRHTWSGSPQDTVSRNSIKQILLTGGAIWATVSQSSTTSHAYLA